MNEKTEKQIKHEFQNEDGKTKLLDLYVSFNKSFAQTNMLCQICLLTSSSYDQQSYKYKYLQSSRRALSNRCCSPHKNQTKLFKLGNSMHLTLSIELKYFLKRLLIIFGHHNLHAIGWYFGWQSSLSNSLWLKAWL